MKNILTVALLISFTSLLADTHILLAPTRLKEVSKIISNSSIEVSFNIERFQSDNIIVENSNINRNFKELKFRSMDVTSEVGEPTLPFYPVIVMGTPEEIEVNVSAGDTKVIDGLVPVPYQSERKRCVGCNDKTKRFDYNPAVYTNFVPKYFSMQGLGDFRGIPLTVVNLLPARFNGLRDRFEINPNIRFSITSKNRGISEFVIDKILKDFLKDNRRYLIVSPSRYFNALKPFVDWKKSNGLQVDLVSLESVGSNFETIQKYLKKRYKDRSTKYLYALLVGDEKTFPTDYVYTTSDGKTPSDLGYFIMGGVFDFVPDVLSGRLVVSSEDDVKNQVAKILQYEKKDFTDASKLKKIIGIASREGSNPSDEEYLADMLKPFESKFGMKSDIYLEKNYSKKASDLAASLNEGAGWLNYIGHGSGYDWPSTNGSFSTDHIEKLTNYDVKPIVIDVACLNGRFAEGHFGERLMNEVNNDPVGAVAYYGGSVSISWRPPAVMAIGINEMVAQKNIETLGAALMAGQIYLAANYTNKLRVYENYRWYHLFGDPSMKLNLR